MSEQATSPVNIFIKVVDPKTLQVLFENLSEVDPIKSDVGRARKFLREYNRDLNFDSSGYNADISASFSGSISGLKANDVSSSTQQEEEHKRRNWQSLGSTLSTIPGGVRASIPTVCDDKSVVTERISVGELRASGSREPILTSTQRPSTPMKEARVILTSTKLNDTLPIVTKSSPSLSNGEALKMESNNDNNEDHVDVDVKTEDNSDEKSDSHIEDTANVPKTKGRKRRKPATSTSTNDSDSGKNTSAVKNTQPSKRRKNDVFDSSSNETPNEFEKNVLANSNDIKSNETAATVQGAKSASLTVTTDSSDTTGATNIEPAISGSRPLDKDEEKTLDKSATLWGCIGIGEWVFARWRDKNYYSGTITEKGLNDTWVIQFEDEMDGVASETHILPIKIIGMNVKAVYSPDNIYRPSLATVVGQKFGEDKEKVEYAIKCNDLPHLLLCQRKQLSLKESEAKELRRNYQSTLPKAADLSLDNILAGPRRRGVGSAGRKVVGGAFDASTADDSVLRDSGAGTPTPKKPGPSKLSVKTVSVANSSTSTTAVVVPSADLDTTSELTTDTGYFGTPTQSSVTVSSTTSNATASPYIPKTPTQGNANNVHNKETPKGGASKESAKKGKGATDENLIFQGYQFFLTASGGGDPSSSGANEAVLQYEKEVYKKSIEDKGGKVIDSVGREKGKDNIFLISDSHARTVKYIYCLAAGIPCVSHTWISKCLEEDSVVDWKPFELSSGWSLEQEHVIPAHQKKPLKNLKVYVTAEQEDLYNYWKPVLMAAEATLLKPKKKPAGLMPPETEVLVTDSTCSQELLDYVKEHNIPLVKPEWLVQTIITGERADYNGHERYAVNPVSGEENGEEEEDE